MKELELQFGRPDAIAIAETEKLKLLPRCTDSPKDICTFANKLRSSVTTLKALQRDYYLTNAELMRSLTEKLPVVLRTQWYKVYTETHNAIPDLNRLSKFLTEQASYCSPFAPPETSTDHAPRRAIHRTYTTVERNGPKCRVCEKEGHYSSDCEKFNEANSDKRWELAKKCNLCFRCLRPRYQTHKCKRKKCTVEGCTASHHHLLHYEKKDTNDNAETSETVANTWLPAMSQTYLKIVPVRVVGPAGEMEGYALLDDGSTVSLIDDEIANKIGAEGRHEHLKMEAINNIVVDTPSSRRVKVSLIGQSGIKIPFMARTVPDLLLSPQSVKLENIAECKHLDQIIQKLTYINAKPKILIGQDNWNLLLADEVCKGPRNEPIASRTPLGWVLHGAHTRTLGQRVNFINRLSTSDEDTSQRLNEFFDIESLMINPCRPQSDPERKAEEILNKYTRQLDDGHVETALLWKKENIAMPNNYNTAFSRLTSIERKLDKNLETKAKYNEQMNAFINKGYAEQAPKETTPGRTWYLPHFDVHNPMKPNKFRIVHDAAAKTQGVCLNDHLLSGPDLLQSLPGVLMRFRRHPIAVSADIADMFMQVKIRPADRDALRFLWRGDSREGAPVEYRMTSAIFGAASSPCMAIFAKDWNAKKYSSEHPRAVEGIVQNHYMDDYLDSFLTTNEALETAQTVKKIHAEAHFDLRKWVSNSAEIVKTLEPTQGHDNEVNLGNKEEKILGLVWKPYIDMLSFNLQLARLPANLLEKENPSKREALRIVMSLYDPLGFASPVTVRAKNILQETWRRNIEWDQPLDKDLSRKWTEWTEHLKRLKDLQIPRQYLRFSEAVSRQIHVFTDASETAYAAVSYWRIVTADGQIQVSLIAAKAKVTPLKMTSIPRLELQAAVLGSRLAAVAEKEHNVKPDSIVYWTDSKTILTWLKTGARSYKPFVAHRLAAIEELSKAEDWRWVPTKLNVADVATREVPRNFDNRHEWFRGPAFLYDDPTTWPNEKPTTITPTGEERVLITKAINNTPRLKEAVPDVSRFSKWERLVRATAYVLKFVTLCKRRTEKTNYKRTKKVAEEDPDWRQKKGTTPKTKNTKFPTQQTSVRDIIEAEFVKEAENLLVRASQQDSFLKEIIDLKTNKIIANDSRLRLLPVKLEDDVIVIRSRIAAAEFIPETMKTPIILDGDHPTTQLYIDWTHRTLEGCGPPPWRVVDHSGVETVINEVRQFYWVIRLRPITKMIIGQCLKCRIKKSQPPIPPTGDHPKTRLAHHTRPFTFTGLDYFGPLSVTVGRQHQKRYVALFTCLTTRAVHLEIAGGLNTDSAILALRRFAARRGCPTEIYSDNGTNMHGAARELREALQTEASRRNIVWRFITPSAPFMGGAWERMVRCVKNALTTVLNERHPHEEVLATLLCEVEYTVNSRPLTHVSTDYDELEAITPNHFLLGGSVRLPSPGTFDERDLHGKKQWRKSQALADMFWRRWVREYLPELQHRREPHGRGPRFKTGDLVLITDGQLPRNTWPRGRIQAVYPGADGEVRTVEVHTAAGVLKRPTKKLIPLPM